MENYKNARKMLRYIVMFYLLLGAFGGFILAVLNPESYFLGRSISGAKATAHLMVNSLIALYALRLIMERRNLGWIVALFYFGYNGIEVLMSNYILGFGLVPSPFFTTGLIFTGVFLVIRK